MRTKNGSVMHVRRQSRYVHADNMEVSLSVTFNDPVMAADNYFSHSGNSRVSVPAQKEG